MTREPYIPTHYVIFDTASQERAIGIIADDMSEATIRADRMSRYTGIAVLRIDVALTLKEWNSKTDFNGN